MVPQTELWLTPLILLPGVALLIMSTSTRFGQIHDEFHHFFLHPDNHAKILSKQLLRRGLFFRDALVCLYASAGLFSLASLLGGVFNLWAQKGLWAVGGLTLVGIGSLVFASVQLVRESLLCIRLIREHSDRIEDGEA